MAWRFLPFLLWFYRCERVWNLERHRVPFHSPPWLREQYPPSLLQCSSYIFKLSGHLFLILLWESYELLRLVTVVAEGKSSGRYLREG